MVPRTWFFVFAFVVAFWLHFGDIFSKINEICKNEKVAPDMKIYRFCEDHQVRKKNKEVWKNTIEKTLIFHRKIDEKSMRKLVAATFPVKIYQNSAMGASLFKKYNFSINFGVPGGTQESSSSWPRPAWSLPGTPPGAPGSSRESPGPSRYPPGTLRAPSGHLPGDVF